MGVQHLKFTGVHDIVIESIVVKDKTSETEGDKGDNFKILDGSLGYKKNPRRPDGGRNLMSKVFKRYTRLVLLESWINNTLE